MKKIIIAIDGYSSCGKSSFAKQIAQRLHYIFVDTGAMYRAVTLYALRQGYIGEEGINEDKLRIDIEQGAVSVSQSYNSVSNTSETLLNHMNVETLIRTLEVSQRVSSISTLSFVRSFLVNQQQNLGSNGGIVMDGRDIGTTVFPNADLKLFMTASAEVRAQRRLLEMRQNAKDITFEEILQNIIERDNIDENRAISPLRKADDAIVLDNSTMTITEQMIWIGDILENRFGIILAI